jgi:hypothetical protein
LLRELLPLRKRKVKSTKATRRLPREGVAKEIAEENSTRLQEMLAREAWGAPLLSIIPFPASVLQTG